MAAVLTLLKGPRTMGGGGFMGIFDLTFGADTYAAGGQVLAPPFANFSRVSREPDFVGFSMWNGFTYEYDPVNKKVLIRVATTAGTNLPEVEHTAVTIVAGARTNIRVKAIWLPI